MARPFRLSRRAALRGAGISVGLPSLEAMAPAGRARAASPKRFVFVFTSNGYIRNAWTPTGSETTFQLGRSLAPLERHRGDIIVLDGVENVAAENGPGDDHMRGMGCMLTGTELLKGSVMGGAGDPAGLAGGVSVDQAIVQRLKPATKFPSLELGVQAGKGTVWGYSNYQGANRPLPLDSSPKSAFVRLFKDFAGSEADLLRLRARRKSVLDAVMRSYQRLEARLGAQDRQKLDAHLTAVQDLEARLLDADVAPIAGPGCRNPAAPTTAADGMGNENFPLIGKLQMDHLVSALACNLTRVATLQWSNSGGGVQHSWVGATRGHHDMGHDPSTNLATVEMLTKIDTWYAEQFAALIDRMKQVPEDGGTLLDNTLVLWANELSAGNHHSHDHMPFVLAGRAGGAVKSGRFLRFNGVSHNNLLVSILNGFDIPVTTFGNPRYCTGALAGLA